MEQVLHRIYRDPEHFSPEFLNRTTIVFANFLSPEVIAKIAQSTVKDIEASVQETHPEFKIQMDEQSAVSFVADNYDKAQGARIVKDILERTVGDEADRRIIEAMRSKSQIGGTLNVQYRQGSGFVFGFSGEATPIASTQFAAGAKGRTPTPTPV